MGITSFMPVEIVRSSFNAAAYLCQPKQIMIKQQSNDEASNYTEQNSQKLSSCAFFADNFREFATLN